jgi:quercetin dioxygenase-like cupin family protein
MERKLRLSIALVIVISVCKVSGQTSGLPDKGNWVKGAPDRFKGNVWVEYFINDTISDFVSSRVMFEPAARSNWHKHSGKQIVFAVEGEGYLKVKGKPISILKKGDVFIVEPGVIHSHGSINKRFLQGIMMNGVGKKESTTWLNPVLEEELVEK